MRCAVIGSGSWGTAIARHLGRQDDVTVTMWAHSAHVAEGINERHKNPSYLQDAQLEAGVRATTDLVACVSGADAVVYVTPSTHLREVARASAGALGARTPAIVLTKGIEQGSGRLMIDVVSDEVGAPERLACLSGPNLAGEIARDLPAASVIAARDKTVGAFFQGLFHSELFRTYLSDDVVGVETCGAAKNVVAIACGIAHGLGMGDNTAAMLMTRGLAEMSRLVQASGGNPLTCMGLAGMGDLVATCTSPRSRNFSFGEGFARGETIEQYGARTHMVVEGYYACASIRELAARLNVEAPLTNAVYELLHEHRSLDATIQSLFERAPRKELYGIAGAR